MANTLVDARDQEFVLYEMPNVEELCKYPAFASFSRGMFDMVFAEAEKLAKEVIFPTLHEVDREGARLDKDGVHVPKILHDVYKRYCEGSWLSMRKLPEYGSRGLPSVITTEATEWFKHNLGFAIYLGLIAGTAQLIKVFGTKEQKRSMFSR